jgi:DNA-binding winged helix-turn-helix (wHTH) protein/TolB-like protein
LYGFGPFHFDVEERVLLRDGQPVTLPPKDLETLLVLVERGGHIVEKEELLEKVWPRVFIEEGNLARHIFNLRQVLGDSPDGRKYIETIPKRGYRFVAPVQEDAKGQAAPPVEVLQAAVQPPTHAPSWAKKNLWLWAPLLTLAVALPVYLLSRHYSSPAGTASDQHVMLAVLLFVNLSGDAREDYFADGLTEEMIAQLGQLQPSRLGVIARTSTVQYKDTKETIAQIGRELGVAYLLEGSVRRGGDRVRITAQSIRATEQTQSHGTGEWRTKVS